MTEESDSIDLTLPDGTLRQFTKPENLRAYFQSELKFWQWLFAAIGTQRHLQPPATQLRSQMQQVIEVSGQLSSAAVSDRQQAREQLDSVLELLTAEGLWIPASDPRAQFAMTVAESDPLEGAFAWLTFVQPADIPTNVPLALSGLVRAQLFLHGVADESCEASARSLEELQAQWNEFVTSSMASYAEIHGRYEQQQGLAATIFEQHSEEHRAATQEREERFQEALTGEQEALEAISRTYDTKLALLAPVEYWKKRAGSHKWRSAVSAVAFIACGFAVAYLANFLLVAMFPGVWEGEFPENPGYGRLGVIVAVAGFAVWPARLLSRILLSNLHLLTDAEERVTMLNTYLSLLRSEGGLADSDRKLILDALFRTAATGIVKDDASGSSTIGQLSKVVSGERS